MSTVEVMCTLVPKLASKGRHKVQTKNGATLLDLLNKLGDIYGIEFREALSKGYFCILINGISILPKDAMDKKLEDNDSIFIGMPVFGG